LFAAQAFAQGNSPTETLQARLGQPIRICGVIVQASCTPPDDSHLTLEVPKGAPGVSIVVPRALRATLGPAYEMRMLQRQVCATGKVSRPEKRFIVTVEDASLVGPGEGVTARVFAPDVVSPCDTDVVIPKLRREVKPAYTRKAMEAGVQGTVLMAAVVEVTGRVGEVQVVRSLRSDLDEEAVKAVKGWQFQPGTRNGAPAPIVVSVELYFKLRG